jgi:hypothetical protein
MLGCSAGCIGCWNHFDEDGHAGKYQISMRRIISGKSVPKAAAPTVIELGQPHPPQDLCIDRLAFYRVVSREKRDALGKRRLECCAIFEHHRYAILHRIVAAATIAMQPSVQGGAGTRGERVMAYGANQDFEQCLGQHRAQPLKSLDQFMEGAYQQAGSFTMSAAARMVHD